MATMDEERARRIEDLVRRVEKIPDRESRESAQELMASILELHGEGLDRMLQIVIAGGESGAATIRRFTTDSLVSNLLLLHDLHPDDTETRIREALRKMHGKAELVGFFDGVARVRLSGDGCGLRESVEAAVRDAAPDAAEIVLEERPAQGFVPLTALGMALPGTT
jgi:hypothetical protein